MNPQNKSAPTCGGVGDTEFAAADPHAASSAPSHTPGPWEVFGGPGERYGIEAGRESLILWGDIDDPGDLCGVRGSTPEIAAANAHLIAAAPALLEALLNFTAGRDISYVAALEVARAAIAKVEGRS